MDGPLRNMTMTPWLFREEIKEFFRINIRPIMVVAIAAINLDNININKNKEDVVVKYSEYSKAIIY